MADANSKPTVPLNLYMDRGDGVVSLTASIPNEPVEEDGAVVTRGKIVGHVKSPIKRWELDLKGIAGVKGKVLPPGRLPALMQHVRTQERMDALCWGVLRRYATCHNCNPRARQPIRNQAYQVIKRAWERAGVDQSLRRPLTGFWSDEVPPGDGTLWQVSDAVYFGLGPAVIGGNLMNNLVIEVYLSEPLDKLLDPTSGL